MAAVTRLLTLFLFLPLGGCAAVRAPSTTGEERIVSIDYCADQAVLGLVPRGDIAAVSQEADSDPGYAAPRARGLPRIRPDAEAILALRPTLVVRSYAGGPRFDAAMARGGVRVVTLPYAASLPEIGPTISQMAKDLGAEARGAALRADWDGALARAHAMPRTQFTALYTTPGDVTSGPDSLIMAMATTAGLQPYFKRAGWHPLPIEELQFRAPDVVLRGFFDSPAYQQDRWSASRHKRTRAALNRATVAEISGYALACGNWTAAAALNAMTGAAARAGARGSQP